MSKFTTGEVAKLCGVTVRTVQYYDTRGLLVPSELSEGGMRLYSEDDVRRMKVICFLRELGLPINSIVQLLEEDDPGSVITLLLEQQETQLKGEIDERENQLAKVLALKSELKGLESFSVESIGDIALVMTNREKLRRFRILMLLTAIPLAILQWSSVILWIACGIWWLFVVWIIVAIPYCILFSRWYFKKMAYICPQCHEVFQPSVREGFWAAHTPSLLTAIGAALYFLAFPKHFDLSGEYLVASADAEAFDAMQAAGLDCVTYVLLGAVVSVTCAPLINAFVALGEEIGWRGFLYPQLKARFGRTRGLVLGGVIWGAWHWPLIALIGYEYGAAAGNAAGYVGYPILGMLVLCVFTVALGILCDWAYEKSDSIWLPALLHGAINAAATVPLMVCAIDTGSFRLLGPAPNGLLSGLPFLVVAAALL